MNKIVFCCLFLFPLFLNTQSIQSPSKEITLNFRLSDKGQPSYTLSYKSKPIILRSRLGIKLKEGGDLVYDFSIFNETWQPVVGEQSNIINQFNELAISLSQTTSNRKMNIIFKVYDEGVAFPYEFPKQEKLNYF